MKEKRSWTREHSDGEVARHTGSKSSEKTNGKQGGRTCRRNPEKMNETSRDRDLQTVTIPSKQMEKKKNPFQKKLTGEGEKAKKKLTKKGTRPEGKVKRAKLTGERGKLSSMPNGTFPPGKAGKTKSTRSGGGQVWKRGIWKKTKTELSWWGG